jgi:hypothetical protein
LPAAEELVVGVAAAVSASDLGETGGEVDAGQPFDLLEAELDLVAQPQRAPCPRMSGGRSLWMTAFGSLSGGLEVSHTF